MAYRTEALKQVGGFDERFQQAFREDAQRGRIRTHAAITTAGVAACALAAAGHGRAAAACALGWAAGTAEFARTRIARGPRTRHEVTTMVATSVLIPPAATWHRLTGAWRHRHASAWQEEMTP
jgi:hypothetical protein